MSPPFTDSEGYRLPGAPKDWPFGRLRPDALKAWEADQLRKEQKEALLGAEKAPF